VTSIAQPDFEVKKKFVGASIEPAPTDYTLSHTIWASKWPDSKYGTFYEHPFASLRYLAVGACGTVFFNGFFVTLALARTE
jgi:hypothetical protein